MKTLSTNQIQEIREFVISKDIKYYEIIEELTDHLASSIEEKNTSYENLEKLLQLEYENFGSFKFLSIQEDKERRKFREYKTLFFDGVKIFFTLPLIITTIAIILLITLTLNLLGSFNPIFSMLLMMSPIVLFSCIYLKDFLSKKRTKVKLLLDRTYQSTVTFALIISSIYYGGLREARKLFELSLDDLKANFFLAIGYTISILSIYVVLKVIRPIYTKEKEIIIKTVIE
ncbi:hypothetical protein HX071_11950 [Myroides marinus]|uniref:Uncharacterized protein n=1 Tax=Myroides marinus TaxID=703342 RepID=A0A1H6XA91_9FLAO|nr:hypothetical protein [Myroides marinus]MDM1374805.1 hypothetical protein [Myroides marinus]MDM1502907.1 hypothetical protein [Myroides marinus]SEJ21742.1 hypothetical protein SAMN04488018_11722 [Myroides marinus]